MRHTRPAGLAPLQVLSAANATHINFCQAAQVACLTNCPVRPSVLPSQSVLDTAHTSPLLPHRAPEGKSPGMWSRQVWVYKCVARPFANKVFAVLLAITSLLLIWGEVTIPVVSGRWNGGASCCSKSGAQSAHASMSLQPPPPRTNPLPHCSCTLPFPLRTNPLSQSYNLLRSPLKNVPPAPSFLPPASSPAAHTPCLILPTSSPLAWSTHQPLSTRLTLLTPFSHDTYRSFPRTCRRSR